jgi:hypothetical protein
MGRLRRVDCGASGITRRRRGKGFEYLDENGERVEDLDVLDRIRALAIPPAWKDVWICADPLGHIQATGMDDRGRKQYRYHDRWRERRDREKFERDGRVRPLAAASSQAGRGRSAQAKGLPGEGAGLRRRFDGGLTVGGVFERLPEDPADWPEIQRPIEEAVLDLIDRRDSPSLERVS